MPSANRQRDVDWILSAGSNCHVVKSLACFSSYTPLRLQLKGSGAHPVHRVGTVKLHTLIPSTDRNGGPRPRTVISNDVLYVPSSTVNIGGAPVWQQSELFRFEDKCTLSYKRANKPAVMLVTPFLTKLWLAGAQPNETSIPTKGRPNAALPNPPPYPAEEHEWLGQHHGGKLAFLRHHGLKIRPEKDRVEGRRIMRQRSQEMKIAEEGKVKEENVAEAD